MQNFASGPVLIVGCGRLGSALVEGWLEHGPVDPRRLMIMTPSPKAIADRAERAGATINPGPEELASVQTVVLAVKPAVWRAAVADLPGALDWDAVIISLMAGVRAVDIHEATGRSVVRVMPTTAVAQGRGVAAVWSEDRGAVEAAARLFEPLADIVPLAMEDQIDGATAVAGSGPAYIHAFARAMAEAGVGAGLSPDDAVRLARGAVRSAAAAPLDDDLEQLIARIASPGGTTQAGLKAAEDAGLSAAAKAAVSAALRRARELSGQ